jgi:hypothetical protein
MFRQRAGSFYWKNNILPQNFQEMTVPNPGQAGAARVVIHKPPLNDSVAEKEEKNGDEIL